MTEEAGRQAVADELRLADSALAAAQALLDLSLAPDAASRAYYAAFHAARALLFSAGLEPRSHVAVRSLLSRHFVRTGEVNTQQSKDSAELAALRTASDYDSAFALGVEDVRSEVDKAARFVAAARAALKRRGF